MYFLPSLFFLSFYELSFFILVMNVFNALTAYGFFSSFNIASTFEAELKKIYSNDSFFILFFQNLNENFSLSRYAKQMSNYSLKTNVARNFIKNEWASNVCKYQRQKSSKKLLSFHVFFVCTVLNLLNDTTKLFLLVINFLMQQSRYLCFHSETKVL